MKSYVSLLLIVLCAIQVFSMSDGRIKRSYNNNEHSGPTGYGLGSEERHASMEDNVPCRLFGNSGNPEYGYDPHEQQDHGYRKGISTSVKAAATASASFYR